MKRLIVIFLFFGFISSFAAESSENTPLPYTWNLLWTGYYYNSIRSPGGEERSADELLLGGTFYNRFNFSLNLPGPDLSLRFLATDKRLLPFTDNDSRAGFNPAFGIYHRGSGSRFLFGVQSEYGLPARINNIWARSVPYMESRSPSSRDLKNEPSATDRSQAYLYLALPGSALLNAFFSAALDKDQTTGLISPAFSSGIGFKGSNREFRLEGFYAQKTLSSRTVSTWFSSQPPLPKRDFRLYALGFTYNEASFGFASDWAYSETFAWGKGLYGNFALRLGNKLWRFSLSGDAASSRYVDRSGSNAGSGFRMAARLERFWPRSGLLRIQGTFRSTALEDGFNRGNLSVYYRPSAPTAAERRSETFPIRFNRASISLNRDARDPLKTSDVLDAMAAYTLVPLSGSFSINLMGLDNLSETNGFSGLPLFQPVFFDDFESMKISSEISFKPGIFDVRTRLGHTFRAKKDPVWDFSLNISALPGKWGRFGLRIASTDFPERWNYTLNWRLNK